jgi:nicotinate phosphoribosyltransferase
VGTALMTDLYELNMAASYLRRGMDGRATFSLFVRRLPPRRGFLVAAGLEDCLTYLESFRFVAEDLDWLAQAGFDSATVDALARLRFTGDVHAVPEGRVVLADEPLLEVTAPIAEAQLAESILLNQVTYQTAIATKAVRCRLAAGHLELVDFALRRTHGVEASLAVARLSAIAGFVATSNVEAARRFGLRAAGTMAHSYIEAFEDEAEAFRAFAADRPGQTTFLVDTYDTRRGVDRAIEVIRELGAGDDAAIRIDSGDLAASARWARERLDRAGLTGVRILVSGGLDEYDLERLVQEGAPIDAAGVGTRMGVSADAPTLDSVYKLVAYGDRPVLKLSAGKVTLPGAKQVWRRRPIDDDLLAGREEPAPSGREPLLVPVMQGGARVGPVDTLRAARERLQEDLAALPATALGLEDPSPPPVRVTTTLTALAEEVTSTVGRRSGGRRAAD